MPIFILAMLIFCAVPDRAAAERATADRAAATRSAGETVYYRAFDQNLPLALRDVAESFNLLIKMHDIPNHRLKGEYELRSLEQFLNPVARRYLLDWFILDRTLFVESRKLRQKRVFSLKTMDDLEGFHHFFEKEKPSHGVQFPVELDAGKMQFIIEAPEPYLRRLSYLHKRYETRHQYEEEDEKDIGEGYGVMMFRLQNAWAVDKTYKFADTSYTVSGVATLLQQITGAAAPSRQSGSAPALGGNESVPEIRPLAAPRRQAIGEQMKDEKSPQRKDQENQQNTNITILADERLNTVLIYDDRKLYSYYKKLIKSLDKKSELVEIEAMIVDVAKDHINDLGVNWQVSKGRDAVGFGNFGESLVTAGTIALSGGLGGLGTALTSNLGGVLAQIRFLETKGESRVVSRPSVVTMDNLEAIINTSQRFFVRVTGFQDSSLYPVEVGTTLRVTPHIISRGTGSLRDEDPHIQIFVVIEDGAVDESESSRVDGLPRIQENKVSTQAVVEQGESLLIGGHIHTTTSDSITRVPILGHIPLLGYFFSSSRKIEKEFIRLFIIRPRVHE